MRINNEKIISSYKYFTGIDTGIKGGMVTLDEKGNIVLWNNMPKNEKGQVCEFGILDILKNFPKASTLVAYEKCQFNRFNQKKEVAWYFGRNYQKVVSTLKLVGVHRIGITPVTWKSEFGLIKKSKLVSVSTAIQLYPNKKEIFKHLAKNGSNKWIINDGVAEAAIIAMYLKRWSQSGLTNKTKGATKLVIKKGREQLD